MALGICHNPNEWCLFVESSFRSPKYVLQHNRNQYPSIPIGHFVYLKEDYENVKFLLETMDYNRYKWQVWGDFKYLASQRTPRRLYKTFLLCFHVGQGGYTKLSCFVFMWDSRVTSQHYHKRHWPQRKHFIPGTQNVKYHPW